MKRLFIPLILVIFLAACAPAAPTPTATPLPPTVTVTAAAASTSTAEPTATVTVEPTEVPMPEGWTAVAETREIGGRQVALNEAGDAATQIDGEWYPVDAKGCFYKEFFDPANQTDPKIDELIQKINGESSISIPNGADVYTRHFGVTSLGYTNKSGKYPHYLTKIVDAIVYKQELCVNSQTGEWEHILQYVEPYDSQKTPNTTKVMRAVVGWFKDDDYSTFTYKQQEAGDNKASSVKEAFGLWQEIIDERKQVGVELPLQVIVNNLGRWTDKEYETALRKLVIEAPIGSPNLWQDNLSDSKFVDWALLESGQMKYQSNKNNWKDLWASDDNIWWKYWGERMSAGKMPELVIRTVRTQ